jgi:hypothetical protein
MTDDVANRFARQFGLLQNLGKDAMKAIAARARELEAKGLNLAGAAITAVKEKHPADFDPLLYKKNGEPIETLLADIERL